MPTWAELDILACLWDKDSTAAEIVNELAEYYEYEFAPTTILTMLNTLRRKGWVGRRKKGRKHRYHALLAPEAVQYELHTRLQGSPVRRFLRFEPD